MVRKVSQQKSPAEFFAENKTIAGFDTPAKSLYTSVRELVENSLDAAERVGVLPDVNVTLEEISLERFQKLYGVEATERIDKGLYKDVETEKERTARMKKQKQARDKAEREAKKKAAKTGESVEDILRRQEAGRKAAATKSRRVFYRLTCKDNGSGMPSDDIPNMLGRVLSSTKYNSVMQTRGKFGLGAKMVLIWSQMRVAQPMEVKSAVSGQGFVSFHRFNIDLHKNAPIVREHRKLQNPGNWRGTEISVVIEGNFGSYKQKLLKYLKLIAIITPYASFDFRFVAEEEKNSFYNTYTRRTDRMPEPPREAKHHPSDVDLELLKKKIAGSTNKKLSKFLSGDFSNITSTMANRMVTELKLDIAPRQMNDSQLLKLHNFMQQVRFADPDGKDLSPAGEYNLRLGVMKELNPDMVATHQGTAYALEGHAFIVEAAVSIGGKDPAIEANQLNVFRFANRIPLLFEQGNDVITRTANQLKWNKYKIGLEQGIGVFVSIVSTKIPFKGTSKEYIGENDKISAAIKRSLEQCAQQLRTKLAKKEEAKQQGEKKKNLELYIPDVSRAVHRVLSTLKDFDQTKKRCIRDSQEELLDGIKKRKVLVTHFTEALKKYVDKKYEEDGLQYQMQNKNKSRVEDIFLASLASEQKLMPPLTNGVCTIQFLK
ncbi:subunit B of DNA topoisomerase VI [Chloropicon primus]|uniref:DNA topoisomerase 6 subunit B n=1 Tax=Chloropicon primus TaxID=1764295 RepID=A0A5B8MPE3_9CHLO|nr:subunit B of DNA topoisomerase VI [Chloropicon primus]UPR01596.1 subunit B of DNA topoisomerase VI [Chloropicon primus]|mmetsp:Transcript_3516/g.9885  ORF Transcript_3516/g.9885 Transcript_3516/m.9885 type:complete len:658 (+) Transcript_3516:71-2044(+)|eukprot:QDZ22379.1 subunit B of DNA topoisomerase VI [Chloropicon primus]